MYHQDGDHEDRPVDEARKRFSDHFDVLCENALAGLLPAYEYLEARITGNCSSSSYSFEEGAQGLFKTLTSANVWCMSCFC